MSETGMIVVLVHGWSVRSTNTYGELPARLRSEARHNALNIDVHDLWLSKYISFHDEVRLEDISRALEAALRRELGENLGKRPIAIITHSTGGPVVRDWLHRFYISAQRPSPVTHFIMLAPANFGSALAQLGRSRLSRLKTWFNGVEPGTGVLDWLELGSPESLALNIASHTAAPQLLGQGTFTFVLAGASIDHKLYDHINAYTGEMDSDGVVRVASASLNSRYIRLSQDAPDGSRARQLPLKIESQSQLEGVPLAIVAGRSHSGDSQGIMRSIRNQNDQHPTVEALLECLRVRSTIDYHSLRRRFDVQNALVLGAQRVEERKLPGPFERTSIKDPCAQLIFRLRDHEGHAVNDFELLLTADGDSPDRLPPGFFVDRQRNQRDRATLTYYLNAARMLGDNPVVHDGEELRGALPASEGFGLRVHPHPDSGFVHYLPAILPASAEMLRLLVVPQQTTIVDIELHRVVREGVYRLTRRQAHEDFTAAKPGKPLGEE